MNPKRIFRQVLVLGTLSLLVLALGPMEALAFNPQPEPPRDLQEIPSAPQTPAELPAVQKVVPQMPAMTPKVPTPPAAGPRQAFTFKPGNTPGQAGKVFPKVEIHKSGSPGAEGMVKTAMPPPQGAEGMRKIVMPKPGPGKGEVPTENLSLNYNEVKQDYTGGPGSAKGNVEMEWKVEEGTK